MNARGRSNDRGGFGKNPGDRRGKSGFGKGPKSRDERGGAGKSYRDGKDRSGFGKSLRDRSTRDDTGRTHFRDRKAWDESPDKGFRDRGERGGFGFGKSPRERSAGDESFDMKRGERPFYSKRDGWSSDTNRGDRPSYPKRGRDDERSSGKSYGERSFGKFDKRRDERSFDKRHDERPSYHKRDDERPSGKGYGERSFKKFDNRRDDSFDKRRDERPSYPKRDRDEHSSDRSYGERSFGKGRGDRPSYPKRDRDNERSSEKSYGDRSFGKGRDDRPSYPKRGRDDERSSEKSYGDRPFGKGRGDRPSYPKRGRDDERSSEKSYGDRSFGKGRGDRPSYPKRDRDDERSSGKSYGERPFKKFDNRRGERSFGKKRDGRSSDRGRGDRPSYSERDGERADRDDERGTGGGGMNVRQFILRILSDFDSRPGDPERIADKILERKRVEHRDRRFVFEIVYGVLRNRIYLDYVIDSLIPAERGLGPGNIRRILQAGAYQLLFLDRVPDHAAVNESVNLAKREGEAAAGFVNAVLRNVIKNKHAITLPDSQTDLCGRLSVEFSHPKWMVERWLERYGLGDAKKILEFNNSRPAIYLRRKARDISRQQFEFDVRTLCEPGGGYLGLYYRMKVALSPENLRLIQNGLCTVQSPSSGWAVAMMDLRKGQRVADLCSAPGGKATLMAEIVGDEGSVVACDISRFKMGMVMETVSTQGFENIHPLVCDSTQPPFAGHFDKVLLDAPCSGTGVLQRHPDGRFVKTPEDINVSQELQKQLLNSAAHMVGKGGVIVYSTCSLESEENELMVDWFLSEHPDFVKDSPPDIIPAMYIDDNDCLRITPYGHGLDGMFAVRLKRV